MHETGAVHVFTLVDSKGHEFSAMILKIHLKIRAFMDPTKSWIAHNLVCLHSNLFFSSAKSPCGKGQRHLSLHHLGMGHLHWWHQLWAQQQPLNSLALLQPEQAQLQQLWNLQEVLGS